MACIAMTAKGHEFWIDPVKYQTASDEQVVADLRVGQDFEGSSQSYIPRNFVRFEAWLGEMRNDVPGVVGDRPAVNMAAPGEGLLVMVHETTDSFLTWSTWEKFVGFLVHKDAEWVIARHDAGGYSREKVREAYSRYAKSLIAVGNGAGRDQAVGLITEIVALENPYTGQMDDGIDVLVLYEDMPRAESQIEVFEKSPDGSVAIFTQKTDKDGQATIPVQPGHRYMLDAVVLRKPSSDLADKNVLWESLWANLTFEVPQR